MRRGMLRYWLLAAFWALLSLGCAQRGELAQELLDIPEIAQLEDSLRQASRATERIRLKREIAMWRMGLETDTARRIALFEALVDEYSQVDEQDVFREMRGHLENYLDYHVDLDGNPIEPPDSIRRLEQPYLDVGLEFVVGGEGIVDLEFTLAAYDDLLALLPEYYAGYWMLSRQAGIYSSSPNLSWDDLGEWLIGCEVYAELFADRPLEIELLSTRYCDLQQLFLAGDESFSILDGDGVLWNSVDEAWESFVASYPQSPTTEMLMHVRGKAETAQDGALGRWVREQQRTSGYRLHQYMAEE